MDQFEPANSEVYRFGHWRTRLGGYHIHMNIYTKTGDSGDTGLFGGPRVSKDHVRIEAYGTVDELSSHLGLAVVEIEWDELCQLLQQIQCDLFSLGAVLASPDPEKSGTNLIGDRHVANLEAMIDRFDAELPELTSFVLPGGSKQAASLHQARVVCRRAERRVVSLASLESIPSTVVPYLNRLGDLLFVLARWANHRLGVPDIPWHPSVD